MTPENETRHDVLWSDVADQRLTRAKAGLKFMRKQLLSSSAGETVPRTYHFGIEEADGSKSVACVKVWVKKAPW